MLTLLSYPPILRGFVVLIVASCTFPLVGVWVVRLNLLPYRFMLMHGALLGGTLALALNLTPLPLVVVVNVVMVCLADLLANRGRLDAGLTTVFLMVASLGAAMALIYAASVPAQDALGLLWGSLFAVSIRETAATGLFCIGLALFSRIFHLKIQAVIFDRDVAYSAGVDDRVLMRLMLIITGLTVAFAMKIIGALLLDALLLVPVIIASINARSLKELYRRSVLIGLGIGISGFASALAADLPVGAATALAGAAVLGVTLVINQFCKRGYRNEH